MFLEANCGERAPRQNLRRVSKGFDLAGLDDTSHPRVRRRTRDVEMRPRVRDSPREPRLRPRSAAGLSCLHAGLCIFRLLRSVVTVGRPQSSQLCGVKVIGGERARSSRDRAAGGAPAHTRGTPPSVESRRRAVGGDADYAIRRVSGARYAPHRTSAPRRPSFPPCATFHGTAPHP